MNEPAYPEDGLLEGANLARIEERGNALEHVVSALGRIDIQEVKIGELDSSSAKLKSEQDHLAALVQQLDAQVSAMAKLREEDLRRREMAREETRKELFSKGAKTLIATVSLLVLSNFVTSFFQIRADKSRQLFSATSDLYKNLMGELGSIETDATKLRWDIADAESSRVPGVNQGGLLEAQARLFTDQSLGILQRLQSLPFPPEWKDVHTDQGLALQQAWYEMYALIACLERSPLSSPGSDSKRSVNKTLERAVHDGMIDEAAAAKIRATAIDTPPCSRNFQPELIQALRARTAEAEWKHLKGDPLSSLF